MKLICSDCFITLKHALLRSYYWEERVLLIATIILIGPILWTAIPVLGIIFLSAYWAWGFSLTVPFITSWAFSLYYANHDEDGHYGSKRVEIDNEIPWDEVRWGNDFFPKDEVISMLKDAHSCAKCYWSGNNNLCHLNQKFDTCTSWKECK